MKDFNKRIAVVTGGASGIGLALVRQLLDEGATVVIADVEQGALDKALAGLSGTVSGIVTDVSSSDSVQSLAEQVFQQFGACHLLFNNAGVVAPSCNVWETTCNDWTWVHGVNVMGVIHGIQAFVPRMIASGEEGYVINTSSSDGGISPLPYQSVYASSKAAVSIISGCLASQLDSENTNISASVFYPSGGLLDTGIWTTDRNRPEELAREKDYAPIPSIEDYKKAAKDAGMELNFQNLDGLAKFTLDGIRAKRFVIMIGLEDAKAELDDRASRIGRGELPIDLAAIPSL